jgi:cell division protease FtsH
MAATNRIDILDPALVRPGRFDRRVVVDLPDRQGRRAILEIHAKGKPLARDVDLDRVARETQGFSGADLANVMNEAALLAARRGVSEIPFALLQEAVDRATYGVSSSGHVMTEHERRVVAYHEAGHAIVGHTLRGDGTVRKVSIVSRGHTLGQTWVQEDFDRSIYPRSVMLDLIAEALGGQVAEELAFDEISSGSNFDLAKVGYLARVMVAQLGMSNKLGPVAYRKPAREVSDEIDREVRKVVDEAYDRARSVLVGARAALDRIAAALLATETLNTSQFEELLGAVPVLRTLPGELARDNTTG